MHAMMARFERECETLYSTGSDNELRQLADIELKAYMDDLNNLQAIRYFFENSNQDYLRFVAASALKELVSKHWHDIDGADILNLKESLCNFLENLANTRQCEQ